MNKLQPCGMVWWCSWGKPPPPHTHTPVPGHHLPPSLFSPQYTHAHTCARPATRPLVFLACLSISSCRALGWEYLSSLCWVEASQRPTHIRHTHNTHAHNSVSPGRLLGMASAAGLIKCMVWQLCSLSCHWEKEILIGKWKLAHR